MKIILWFVGDKFYGIHILKYERNEARNDIPSIEQSIIDRINKFTLVR